MVEIKKDKKNKKERIIEGTYNNKEWKAIDKGEDFDFWCDGKHQKIRGCKEVYCDFNVVKDSEMFTEIMEVTGMIMEL